MNPPLPPKENVYTLIPGTSKYVTLDGKRDFADVSKLEILRWRDFPGLSRWASYNHKDLYKAKEGGRRVRGDVIKEAAIREEKRCCVDALEDGERDHQPRNAGSL